jgi:hypothetical protein
MVLLEEGQFVYIAVYIPTPKIANFDPLPPEAGMGLKLFPIPLILRGDTPVSGG